VKGTLYVVATPLGHLGDLTLRAAEVLRQVPVVAAEDTRRARGLLTHLGAEPRLLSFHAHSPERRREALLEILLEGRDVALVSDAGTPVVSDPGAELVQAVREAGCRVVPIPGPSAVAAALSVSGLPGDRYLFLGFPPRKGAERQRLLLQAAASEWTVVFFEAPSRVCDLLEDLRGVAGDARRVTVARELTKLHEEIREGTLADVAAHFIVTQPRGEFTIALAGADEPPAPPDRTEEAVLRAAALLADGASRKDTARRITEEFGVPRNEAYRLVMDLPDA
jgi:16S rRNA (cytidine1402-2'-O)-methyltransferase